MHSSNSIKCGCYGMWCHKRFWNNNGLMCLNLNPTPNDIWGVKNTSFLSLSSSLFQTGCLSLVTYQLSFAQSCSITSITGLSLPSSPLHTDYGSTLPPTQLRSNNCHQFPRLQSWNTRNLGEKEMNHSCFHSLYWAHLLSLIPRPRGLGTRLRFTVLFVYCRAYDIQCICTLLHKYIIFYTTLLINSVGIS